MLLWELLSGRRHRNKDKARQQQQQQQQTEAGASVAAVDAPASAEPPASLRSPVKAPQTVDAPDRTDRKTPKTPVTPLAPPTSVKKTAMAASCLLKAAPTLPGARSASSGSLPHQDDDASPAGSTATLLLLPAGRALPPSPVGRLSPQGVRPPDSIKLFKNPVLARRHSTAFGLYPGLLGPTSGGGSGAGGGSGGARSRRRRTDEGAVRYCDRRRPFKYRVSIIY